MAESDLVKFVYLPSPFSSNSTFIIGKQKIGDFHRVIGGNHRVFWHVANCNTLANDSVDSSFDTILRLSRYLMNMKATLSNIMHTSLTVLPFLTDGEAVKNDIVGGVINSSEIQYMFRH